jgi:hypothetical protein
MAAHQYRHQPSKRPHNQVSNESIQNPGGAHGEWVCCGSGVAGEVSGGASARCHDGDRPHRARRASWLGPREASARRNETVDSGAQAEIVPAQLAALGEQRCGCSSCGRRLTSKGHYPEFRCLSGDVPVRVPRLLMSLSGRVEAAGSATSGHRELGRSTPHGYGAGMESMVPGNGTPLQDSYTSRAIRRGAAKSRDARILVGR